jgi:drug/metabolite transporter (DMT)-like permease
MKLTANKANILLLMAAAIWGFAFVAQRVGMQYVGPFTFNGIRFALGALVLVPLLVFWCPGQERQAAAEGRPVSRSLGIKGGLLAGLLVFGGITFQQFGLLYTTAGKAGFITGLYVVFVPVFGLALGHRVHRLVWTGVLLAASGLYLLSANGLMSIGIGDGLVLISAVFWGMHVLAIGYLAKGAPVILLAVVQFVVCAILSLVAAFFFEEMVWQDIQGAWLPILYAGFLSVGVAYTLQVVAQSHAKSTHAALILSSESLFAVIGGGLFLGEVLSPRALAGCGLMLAGIIIAQQEPRKAARQ